MPTVFEVLLQTGRRLDALIESKATTNGTTVTLVDGYLSASNGYTDDQFNGGTLFLKLTTPAIVQVSDFAISAGTVTFTPAQTALVPSGTGYGLMTKRFPYWLMLSKLNEVLMEIRDYITTDEVDVSDLVNGHETEIDDTVKVVEVLAGQPDTATTERQWTRLTRWQHSQGILRIDSDLQESDTIAIRVVANAPSVAAASSTISDEYSTAWLALATAVKCLRWRMSQPGAESQMVTLLLNQLMNDEARERAKNRIANPVTMRLLLQEWPEC
jgi:hypothetical protein